jgi:hypothetical protein
METKYLSIYTILTFFLKKLYYPVLELGTILQEMPL